MKMNIKKLIIISIFTALMCVLSQVSISIPFSPVPITMQILCVCLASVVLGKKAGTLSQVIYILLGLCGFPVFAGFKSGINAILGPTGGYIVSFPFVAFLTGYIIENIEKHRPLTRLSIGMAMAAGLFVCYFTGTFWLALSLNLGLVKALALGVGWYLPFDILKIIISSFLGYEIRHALIKAKLISTSNT